MSSAASLSTAAQVPVSNAGGVKPPSKPLTQWEFWGRMLLIPYIVIFFVFVLYPVFYGFWLARHPESYSKIFGLLLQIKFVLVVLNNVWHVLKRLGTCFLFAVT